MKTLCEKLSIKPLPCYEKVFDAAMEEYAEKGSFIAEDERISECISRFGIFKKWEDALCEAASGIRKNELLLQYVYLLKHAVQMEGVFDELLEIELPENEAEALSYDFASLFALLPLLPEMEARLEKRNLPREVIMDCFQEFEANADNFYAQFKKPGLRHHVVWLYKFIHCMILRVGRLNFEIFKGFDAYVTVFESKDGRHEILLSGKCFSAEIKETDAAYIGFRSNPLRPDEREEVTLLKSEWKPFLKRDDPIVSVHIPAGRGLLPELCEASYAKMLEILRTYYPDYKYKIFSCEHSWLMEPHLADFLPENANIMQFQKKYTLYQNDANGKGVYTFLFHVPEDTPLAELPEDSSLRRAIKKLYLDGGKILEQGGLIFETKTEN